MYAGYAGLMLCRTAMTVASPGMIEDPTSGLTEAGFGELLAYGAGGALAGKLVTGVGADLIGGRRLFLLALASMATVTVAFGASSSHAVFMLLSFAAQASKAGGWPAMAKLISSWFEPARHGRLWGVVSTSSRVTSLLSHLALGGLLAWLSWRSILYFAGALAMALVAALYFSFIEKPADVGLAAPSQTDAPAPDAGAPERWETTLRSTAWYFVKSPPVWMICVAIMALTVQMEFQSFLPIYLTQSFGLEHWKAGMAASAFPAGSLLSLLIVGFAYDRVPRRMLPRALGLLLGVGVLAVVVLRGLPIQEEASSVDLAIAVAALFTFGFAISPAYYIPMGVFAIEFGRSRSGILIGIIDAFGYGAAMVVMPMAGRLVEEIRITGEGWGPFLDLLAALSLVSVALMTIFLVLQQRWFERNQALTRRA